MTYNVFGGTLNPAQSNPIRLKATTGYSLQYTAEHPENSKIINSTMLPHICLLVTYSKQILLRSWLSIGNH